MGDESGAPASSGPLLALVAGCASAADAAQVLRAATRALSALTGAADVAVVERGPDGVLELPAHWLGRGISPTVEHDLPGGAGTLVVGSTEGVAASEPAPDVVIALALVDNALARHQVQEEYDDLAARVADAQRLADMGDYDWHIASDTNRWSDQLYRIYGHEPQSFNASYERFLEMVHPDDRERIVGVHREAYRTGEPYQMVERIVRPDGEVRHLSSSGQVMRDDDGTPLRFRGTCLDITERVLAAHEHEEFAAHLAEVRVRRRQALELNDSVVQGLVAASYALELDDPEQAAVHVAGTLAAARGMMDDLMEPLDGSALEPGDLVRSAPADFSADRGTAPAGEARRP